MLFKLLLSYYLYIIIYNLVYNFTFYVRVCYLMKEIFIIHTLINMYESYNDFIYKNLLENKNTCVMIKIRNREFFVKINNVYKINCDIVIFTNIDGITPLYNSIDKITMNPNKILKLYIQHICKKKLPSELIDYIGNYICDCSVCKNIINSRKMIVR